MNVWGSHEALSYKRHFFLRSLFLSPKCMAVLQHSRYQRGRRRWSPKPKEGFNPPPTEGVRSVLDNNHIACQIRQDQSQRANLKGQAPYAGLGSCSPIFFFPQEVGDDRNPSLNFPLLLLLGLLGRFFALLTRSSKMTSKKHRKKCENR